MYKNGSKKIIKMTPLPQEQRCAPHRKFLDCSCYTLKELQEITRAYNQYAKQKKKPILPLVNEKCTLVNQLKSVLSCGNNQYCWLEQEEIFFHLSNKLKKQLFIDVFRPEGPKKKNEWLSTLDINKVMIQYMKKHPEFVFLGAVPLDFCKKDVIPKICTFSFYDTLLSQNKYKIGIIINFDTSDQSGSHWVALFCDLKKGIIIYFDSYGDLPKGKQQKYIYKFVSILNKYYQKRIGKKASFYFNNLRHQYKNSECGMYSLVFLIHMVQKKKYNKIFKHWIPDDEVHKCREVFFINTDFSFKK